MLFSGYPERFLRSVLRGMPVSDYYKTLLWASSVGRPLGRVTDRPYFKSIELALRTLAQPEGQRVVFPEAERYSMLEFGVANGESFKRMLHFRNFWTRRLKVKQPVIAMGFDTFAGIPAPREGDDAVPVVAGDFSDTSREGLQAFLENAGFENFKLIPGEFVRSLPSALSLLEQAPPIFISIDCDYYSSTMDVFRHLLPDRIPHGCMLYLDDAAINFWSDRHAELRAVKEVNEGAFGDNVYFTEFPLYIETSELRHYRQVWRFVNMETAKRQSEERPFWRGQTMQVPRTPRISPL